MTPAALNQSPDRTSPSGRHAADVRRPVRWSHDDYHRMIEAGIFADRRLELFDGEIVAMSPQSFEHVVSVQRALRALIATSPASFEVVQQLPCILHPDTEREPDLVVLDEPLESLGSFPTTPALAIEVSVSTLPHDRTIKSSLYARNKIPAYWIVNVTDRVLEVRSTPVETAETSFGWDYADATTYQSADHAPLPYAPQHRVLVSDLLPPVNL